MLNRRHSDRPVQFRAVDGSPSVIEGHAAVFYNQTNSATEFQLWPGVMERIMPGCFDRALAERQDIRCLFNHDPDNVLGRTSANTCTLAVDTVGLSYACTENPDDPFWRSTAAKVKRGDVSGSSFAFFVRKETWTETNDGTVIREINDVDLLDVGPVTFPAYAAASSYARSADLETERRHIETKITELKRASDRSGERERIEIEYRLRQLRR